MANTTSNSWSFDPITSAPSIGQPNTRTWTVTSSQKELSYQISIAWSLNWTSPDEANGTALSMYVLDGNALGATATEAWRRRAFVDSSQPDGIIISIGYPVNGSVYSDQREIDFQASVPTQPSSEAGAGQFLDFIEATLRPFVHSQFPNVTFSRDALYGHSLGGGFVLYALLTRPGLFDTYLVASAGIPGNSISELVSKWKDEAAKKSTKTKSAVRLMYGTLEARPLKHRTETEEAFQARADYCASFDIGNNTKRVYQDLVGNPNLRDIEIKEYPWSDHASLGAIGVTDGIDYFVDW